MEALSTYETQMAAIHAQEADLGRMTLAGLEAVVAETVATLKQTPYGMYPPMIVRRRDYARSLLHEANGGKFCSNIYCQRPLDASGRCQPCDLINYYDR